MLFRKRELNQSKHTPNLVYESVVSFEAQACCLEHIQDVVVEGELYQQQPPGVDIVEVRLRGLRNMRAKLILLSQSSKMRLRQTKLQQHSFTSLCTAAYSQSALTRRGAVLIVCDLCHRSAH